MPLHPIAHLPTVGRVVWYRIPGGTDDYPVLVPATITRVHTAMRVDLCVMRADIEEIRWPVSVVLGSSVHEWRWP